MIPAVVSGSAKLEIALMTTAPRKMDDKELTELLSLARDKSVSGRQTLMAAVSDLFGDEDACHRSLHDAGWRRGRGIRLTESQPGVTETTREFWGPALYSGAA